MAIRHLTPLSVLLVALTAVSPSPLVCQEAPDHWSSQLEFGFNGATGNSSFSVLRTGGSLKYLQSDVAEFEISSLLRYGKSEDQVIANDIRGAVKFDWHPDADFSPFTFVTASRDVIRKLDAKINAGAGAKWTVLRMDESKVSLSLAGLVDHENYRLALGSTAAASESVFRVSSRLKIDHKFGSGATFSHVTFWQPQASDLNDYTIEMSNSVSTQLLSRLGLAIEHEYLYDSIPPEDVGKTDQKFSVVLRVTL